MRWWRLWERLRRQAKAWRQALACRRSASRNLERLAGSLERLVELVEHQLVVAQRSWQPLLERNVRHEQRRVGGADRDVPPLRQHEEVESAPGSASTSSPERK